MLYWDAGRVFGELRSRLWDRGLPDYRVGAMNVSPIGRAWTAHSEGCCLTAYEDPKGSGTYSIGRGHHGVPEGMVWTQAHAEAQFDADLAHAASILNNRSVVKVDLTQGQFDGLLDWLYNIKQGEFYKSTLLRVLNLAQYQRVPDELRRWIYAGGEPNEGLKARREGEIVLWNGGDPLA